MSGEAPGAREERLHVVRAHPRRLPRDQRGSRLGIISFTGQRGEAAAAPDEKTRERGRGESSENVTMHGTHAAGRGETRVNVKIDDGNTPA
jgi:hypothetical protein